MWPQKLHVHELLPRIVIIWLQAIDDISVPIKPPVLEAEAEVLDARCQVVLSPGPLVQTVE